MTSFYFSSYARFFAVLTHMNRLDKRTLTVTSALYLFTDRFLFVIFYFTIQAGRQAMALQARTGRQAAGLGKIRHVFRHMSFGIAGPF